MLASVSENQASSAMSQNDSYVLDVPYIANYLYEHPNRDLHLKGIWIADPSLTWGLVQQEIPALRFAQVSLRV